jgi:hypothetical protein
LINSEPVYVLLETVVLEIRQNEGDLVGLPQTSEQREHKVGSSQELEMSYFIPDA